MLKEEKQLFQLTCEEYIEKEKLYEMFEDMMKQIIIHRPEDPVQFLINKLQNPQSKYPSALSICITVDFWT